MQNTLGRKGFTVGIILLFVGTCIIPSFAQNLEKTSLPTSRGNWLYVGGSGPGNYTKIQDAINDSSNGTTVFVFNGTYYENIVIDKIITLKGENKNTTIIDGTNSNYSLITIKANGIYIGGFTIRNSSPYYWGIFFELDCDGVSIIDNIIKNNRGAILVARSHNTNISRNIIIDNYCNNSGGAIILSNSSDNIIYGNVIINFTGDYGDSISLSSHSCNNEVYGNTINKSDVGISVGFSSNYNKIFSNSISNCEYCGIEVSGTSYNEVYSNTISNNKYGIHAGWYFSYNNIHGNTISNNLIGIKVEPTENSSDNIFYHNNFLNNTQFNAYVYDKYIHKWDNGYPSGGNYWDDYTGEDIFSGPNQNLTGSDGIGDTPYLIPGADDQDRYPLMEPYERTELAIGLISGGLFRIKAEIKNIGWYNATDINWTIEVIGRFWSGEIPIIEPGDSEIISTGFLLGLGRAQITVTAKASNAEKVTETRDGFIFLFFIIIRE